MQGLRFLPGDNLRVTCDFNSSDRDKETHAGSGSKVASDPCQCAHLHARQVWSANCTPDVSPRVCLGICRLSHCTIRDCANLSAMCSPEACVAVYAQNEMCNMYMMVTSEVPYFMTCGNSQPSVSLAGPGGMHPDTTLTPELPSRWQPPPGLSAGVQAEHLLGQVSGAVLVMHLPACACNPPGGGGDLNPFPGLRMHVTSSMP